MAMRGLTLTVPSHVKSIHLYTRNMYLHTYTITYLCTYKTNTPMAMGQKILVFFYLFLTGANFIKTYTVYGTNTVTTFLVTVWSAMVAITLD